VALAPLLLGETGAETTVALTLTLVIRKSAGSYFTSVTVPM
jgi:hypothetical protein